MTFHRSRPIRGTKTLGSASLLLLAAMTANAQSIPGAVLAKREPHHHLVYEDSTLRVLRVRVAGHDTTLLHEHDPDYFWLGLGTSTVINARLGSPDATLVSGDLKFHYSFGKFAHVARNPEATPFDNITVELLQPQTDVRNLCEEALADKPLDCESPAVVSSGVVEHSALATAQLRVGLATIAPGAVLRAKTRATNAWVIALDSADAGRRLVLGGGGKWLGGTYRAAPGWAVTNRGQSSIRVIVVSTTR
jgi:hypothetical protein